MRQSLKGRRSVPEPTLDDDVAFALVQLLQRLGELDLPAAQLLTLRQHDLVALCLVSEPILPLTFVVVADGGIETVIRRSHAVIHADYISLGNVERAGDADDL